MACLSREQVEQAARDAGLPLRPKLKDTREALILKYRDDRFLPPLARFALTREQIEWIEDRKVTAPDDADGSPDQPDAEGHCEDRGSDDSDDDAIADAA